MFEMGKHGVAHDQRKGVLLLLQARASIGNLGLLADLYQQVLTGLGLGLWGCKEGELTCFGRHEFRGCWCCCRDFVCLSVSSSVMAELTDLELPWPPDSFTLLLHLCKDSKVLDPLQLGATFAP